MENVKEVQLTIPQLVFDLAKQPKKYFEGGRGSGKTTLLVFSQFHVYLQAISQKSFIRVFPSMLK